MSDIKNGPALLLSIVMAMVSIVMQTPVGAAIPQHISSEQSISPEIQAVFNKPLYHNSTWGLRVVDAKNNRVLVELNPEHKFYIGSVRKLFVVGELLNQIGPNYRSITTIHSDGEVNNNELKGNLVLVASGDLTMGGRTNPDGSIAIANFDHNEAETLGNAVLTKPDPLAGYKNLARQVKKSGIDKISGDVIIDERLFDPIHFRDQFNISPLFVNWTLDKLRSERARARGRARARPSSG